jgi:hypothetical protein
MVLCGLCLVAVIVIVAAVTSVTAALRSKGKGSSSGSSSYAVVTLVTGKESPYTAGALALGQSLVDVGSALARVVMVTPDVDAKSRASMAALWEVVEVAAIPCNHQPNLDPTQFDLNGAQYKQGVARWSSTCTKFAAWRLTQYDRVIFMDSDTFVVGPIDDALFAFSNASLVAAPETFPPDNFNAGFMVLTPSEATFQRLLTLNAELGSAEGGDQGIFNNGLCPRWHEVGNDDPDCGRLPWIFNVEVRAVLVTVTVGGERPVSDHFPLPLLDSVPRRHITTSTARCAR